MIKLSLSFSSILIVHTDFKSPIVFITRPQARSSYERDTRLKIVEKTYQNALAAGDKNVWFVPTPKSLEPIGNEGTVDGVHPNDLGFFFMAQGLYPVLKEILER